MEQPRKIVTIKQQVYEILRDDICNGVYEQGQQIQELELARRLSVSRSPIREALRQLSSEGLVVEYPNRGVYVREYTPKDIQDIYDLRMLLESYAIEHASLHVTTDTIKILTGYLADFKNFHDADDFASYIKVDTQLHQEIVELSGNQLVIDTYSRVSAMVYQYRSLSLQSRKRFDESLDEHSGVINGILHGEFDQADKLNREHLTLARNVIIDYIAAQQKNEE